MSNTIPLSTMPVGAGACICGLDITGTMRRRLQDIGFTPGTRVECVQKSPAGDPVAYLVRGAVIALRAEDSSRVLVQQA